MGFMRYLTARYCSYNYMIGDKVSFKQGQADQNYIVEGIYIDLSKDELSKICRSIKYELKGVEEKIEEDKLCQYEGTLSEPKEVPCKCTYEIDKLPGEQIWIKHNNRVEEGIVHSVSYHKDGKGTESEKYEIYVDGASIGYRDREELCERKELKILPGDQIWIKHNNRVEKGGIVHSISYEGPDGKETESEKYEIHVDGTSIGYYEREELCECKELKILPGEQIWVKHNNRVEKGIVHSISFEGPDGKETESEKYEIYVDGASIGYYELKELSKIKEYYGYNYEIGDEVFFLQSNKVHSSKINGVYINLSLGERVNIEYGLVGEIKMKVDELYPDKNTLLDMLRGNVIDKTRREYGYKTQKRLGEHVWIMHNNKVAEGEVRSISCHKFVNQVDNTIVESEQYKICVEGKSIENYELKDLYETKEDLIASL